MKRGPPLSTDPPDAEPTDPAALVRSSDYVVLLVFGAAVGVPVAAIAYGFLAAVSATQSFLYDTLPGELGFAAAPSWWSIPLLSLGGLAVAATIHSLPGTGGHRPAEGLKTGGVVRPAELPGIALAAFATLSLGAVLGPEAPLIAIGGGLGVLAMRLVDRDAPRQAVMVIGGAGSFAAIATLLGSPLVGAFLMMEAAGLGGAMMAVVLVPGLLAAGIGSLIFVGLDQLVGLGTFSLALPDVPAASSPTVAQFLWAIAIGVMAALAGTAITRAAVRLQGVVELRPLVHLPLVGAASGVLVLAFVQVSGRDASNVLFSGQDQLGSLVQEADQWTVGALVLLIACKGLAYVGALSGFRGGPVFPAMFLGAAGGIALSHLPGLPMVAGVGMGIGAMTVAMLKLPFVSVLLATLLLQGDGLQLAPVIIVAVVVSWVLSARLHTDPDADTAGRPATAPDGRPPVESAGRSPKGA